MVQVFALPIFEWEKAKGAHSCRAAACLYTQFTNPRPLELFADAEATECGACARSPTT